MVADAALTSVLGRRTPKTRKGRKIVNSREPQITEEAKTALIVRGNKTSNEVSLFLRDLHRLRTPHATLFMRKHAEHPFEDVKRLEALCSKYDHSLFAFGSSSKKRPFRLILGRLFDGHLLDMQEFGVEDYKPMQSFQAQAKETVLGSKPLVIFQGTAFESDDRVKRVKSLLLDFFRGPAPEKVLLQGLDHVIVCSAFDAGGGAAAAATTAGSAATAASVASGSASATAGAAAVKVSVRRFHVAFSKSGSRLPRVDLEEIGPRCTLHLDRVREPDRERWKQSIKVPKAAKPQKVKNVSKDTLGKRSGRIHLGQQDFDQIHTVHHGKAKEKKLQAELAKRKGGEKGAE